MEMADQRVSKLRPSCLSYTAGKGRRSERVDVLQASLGKVEAQDALRPLWKHPSWAIVGRAWLDPSGTSRAQGKDPQVSMAKKHWKNLITISVLRPIAPLAILSGLTTHITCTHAANMVRR